MTEVYETPVSITNLNVLTENYRKMGSVRRVDILQQNAELLEFREILLSEVSSEILILLILFK